MRIVTLAGSRPAVDTPGEREAWKTLCAVGAGLLLFYLSSQSTARAQTSPHGDIPFQCEDCHTAASWKDVTTGVSFNHGRTGFPLQGQHVQVPCRQCHQTMKFHGTPTLCVDCHQDIHRNELGNACERCHAPQSWLVPDMAQRHARTRFPLIGSHQTLPCQDCHINQQKQEYVNVPVDCFGCHRNTYEATTSPVHRAAGINTDCQGCHSLTSLRWGGSFNHDLTSFPLTGAHISQPCAQCHPSGKFAGTPVQCVSCHINQFNAAVNPKHNPGFPTDCISCHTTIDWSPASFDHSKTSFPLTGAHAARPCSDCHKNNQFAGTPIQCFACHQSLYSSANAPQHSPGLSTDCTGCHNTTAWQPSTFNHASTGYTLTGGHLTATCNKCHTSGQYAGTATTCFACHQADYNGTNNPVHSTAGFPTTCETCHTTISWAGATFNHTWFPQNHGNSGGVCSKCHANPNDYSTYQCTGCHTQSQTDPHHSGVRNYMYNSPACYSCHPQGRAG